jgi:hypothetical protein
MIGPLRELTFHSHVENTCYIPSEENERLYVCVLGLSILSSFSTVCLLDFGIVLTVYYFLLFIFLCMFNSFPIY